MNSHTHQRRNKLIINVTISNDVIMHNPKERRYITMTDLQDTFLHAEMNNNIHMNLEGQ